MTADREYELSVWQDGMEVATVAGADFERVWREAMHYSLVYAQDGETTIRGIPLDKMDDVKGWIAPKP